MSRLFLFILIFVHPLTARADERWSCVGAAGSFQPYSTAAAACNAAASASSVSATVAADNSCTVDNGGSVLCTVGLIPHSDCPASGTKLSEGYYNLGTNPDAPVPRITCDGGCESQYTGFGVSKRAMVNGVYNYYFGVGQYTYNGASCTTGQPTPSAGSVPPNSCDPATQSTGQVNGVTVCLPKSDTNTTNTTTTPPTTDSETGNTTTTTNTTTTNTSTNTTTNVTTTTTTSPDGTVTQTTQETTAPAAGGDFCQKNPADPSCRDPDKDRWNGGGSGKGFGDEGDIATAKANISTRISEIRSEIAAKFQPSTGVTGAIPCESMTVLGQSFSLCMSDHQSTFELIGSALLAIAFILAFLMVFS